MGVFQSNLFQFKETISGKKFTLRKKSFFGGDNKNSFARLICKSIFAPNFRRALSKSTTNSLACGLEINLISAQVDYCLLRTMSFEKTMGWNGTDCGQLLQLLRTMSCMGKYEHTHKRHHHQWNLKLREKWGWGVTNTLGGESNWWELDKFDSPTRNTLSTRVVILCHVGTVFV